VMRLATIVTLDVKNGATLNCTFSLSVLKVRHESNSIAAAPVRYAA
jgi:hypothetical protein